MKFLKGFAFFCWIFLGILSFIVVSDAIANQNGKNLMIWLAISLCLAGLSVVLYRLVFLSAAGIQISEDEITLRYQNRTELVAVSAIQKIIVTAPVYIFVCSHKKFYLSRSSGAFRYEKKENPEILELSKRCQIPLVFFP